MERLRDVSEAELLARIQPVYAGAERADTDGSGPPRVPVGPGDDAAVLTARSGSVVASVDTMVRGSDWRDEWSSAHDVGAKVAAQNIADIAAMGAIPTGLLVSLAADPDTAVQWAVDLARGIATLAGASGASVVGGDLSSAPTGVVVVSITALGDLQGRMPVLRSGARVGDVVAVCGSLGRSGGGLALYLAGREQDPGSAARGLMADHRAPRPPWESGPLAAKAGARAMIDVSDGLVIDAGRVAAASGVGIDLDGRVLRERYAAGALTRSLGAEEAMVQVLSGGEEHSLVACFGPDVDLAKVPGEPWHVVGSVVPAPIEPDPADGADGADGGVVGGDAGRVTVDGVVPLVRGWDHFAG